jgi:hypothetical protein
LLGALSLALALNKIYHINMNSNELFVQMIAERELEHCVFIVLIPPKKQHHKRDKQQLREQNQGEEKKKP